MLFNTFGNSMIKPIRAPIKKMAVLRTAATIGTYAQSHRGRVGWALPTITTEPSSRRFALPTTGVWKLSLLVGDAHPWSLVIFIDLVGDAHPCVSSASSYFLE
jgi:hypothetical protein